MDDSIKTWLYDIYSIHRTKLSVDFFYFDYWKV